MGTRSPCFSSPSTMWGMALAASSLLTVTRTTSLPARARAATCFMVPGMSAVSVLVMDCTITGALLPTRTPPIVAVEVFLRLISALFRVYFTIQIGHQAGDIAEGGQSTIAGFFHRGSCRGIRSFHLEREGFFRRHARQQNTD